MFPGRKLIKWFGLLIMVVLAALALAPGAFRVPEAWRGWIFLAFIGWTFMYLAGFFDA